MVVACFNISILKSNLVKGGDTLKYTYLMDHVDQTEIIRILEPDTFDVVEEFEAVPLFTALCDLMTPNLHEAHVMLLNSKNPLEDAKAISFALTDDTFAEALSGREREEGDINEPLIDLFSWLHYLKAWFVEMQNNPALYNTELFRSYCETMLDTSVPALHRLENNPSDTRLHLDRRNPDYRRITDTFLSDMQAGSGLTFFIADDFQELLCGALYHLVQTGSPIAFCRNCGKAFVALNRSGTLYCDRISPQDEHKTCKEYGAYFARLEKVRSDESTHLYKQLYNRLQNRYRRTKSSELPNGHTPFREETENFVSANKAWKKSVKFGEATEQQYISWLRERKGELDIEKLDQ